MPQMNPKTLSRMVKILAKPHTTRRLSDKLGCTVWTAIKRLDSLRDRGVKLKETKVRESPYGPISTAFTVVPNRASKAILSA